MTTQLPFPRHLHWTAQDLADAVPLRLFEMLTFESGAGVLAPCANELPRRAWRRGYAQPIELPGSIRVHS